MAELSNVERVKILLFGSTENAPDDLQDSLLTVIEDNTTQAFKALTGATDVPVDLSYIICEVMVKRFNRIGSEGMKSITRTDLTHVFYANDFDEYQSILFKKYPPVKTTTVTPGGIFIL
ncbi:phage head-tail connector protein [Streptococcus parauberis]|uniref:phage head-tail connector protein n=1 Tax=Streptococcus parauberis TaxID=1348 RepID=UPI000E300BF8|nr:phage head-tail connector protein [Streptococcus parauberis]RFE01076.1 Phage gp6-like head-tail connector protein [Streptococcus parauberis]